MTDSNDRTNISIVDEHGEHSTITLDKWTSDILHKHLDDVHGWVQKAYGVVCKWNTDNNKGLSRRERGNVVRQQANKKALEIEPPEFNFYDYGL